MKNQCNGSGGAIITHNANVLFQKCTFEDNFAEMNGGTMYITVILVFWQLCNLSVSIRRIVIWRNADLRIIIADKMALSFSIWQVRSQLMEAVNLNRQLRLMA